MTNPYIPLGPPGDTTNRTPKMLTGYRSLPVVNGNPPPRPTGTVGLIADLTIAAGDADTTLTNQPSAESNAWFQRNLWWDTRPFTGIRIVIDDVKTVGAANSRLIAKFATSKANALAGTFIHGGVGGTEVAASMAALGPSKTDVWATINVAAINDVIWRVFAIGGDGALDPVVSGVHIQFLQGAPPDPCGGTGCPMPSGIYNGDDFSTDRYADEAAFIAYVEAESDNKYWVWYGDDGSVEGVSYDPTLTFCNKPVVVGRWVGTAAGSTIWDVIGFGSYTRFSNPVGDTGGSGSTVGFAYVWCTMRLKIESGWSADDGTGFTLSQLIHGGNGINGQSTVWIRDGRIIFGCQADSSVSYEEFDIGPASLLVGTAGFMDLTIHGTISNLGGGLWQIQTEVFVNNSCDVATPGDIGSETATPLATYTATVVPTPIGGVVAFLKFYDWDKFNFTTDHAQWPEKKIWVAQWFYSGSLT